VSQVIVFTPNDGVMYASPLDKSHLNHLARWLCKEKSCSDIYIPHLHISKHSLEQQIEKNSGYCDACRDLAGEISWSFAGGKP
jgi:hypothetical protein